MDGEVVLLNKNHFFRFNNELKISFKASLQKGYEQYLENLIQISDLNKNNIDIILSIENEDKSELLLITSNKLVRRKIDFNKEYFLSKNVNFNFDFNLKEDKLTINLDNKVFVENNLGLKPNNDYRVSLGGKSSNQKSMIQFHDVDTEPDLLNKKDFKIFNQKSLYWFVIILVLDIVAFALYLWFRATKKRAKQRLEVEGVEEKENEEIIYQKGEDSIPKKNKTTVSAVYLFKEFQVYDNNGNDITRKFTPLLKELFLLLLLHSQKREKGISMSLLKDLLWYDKSTHSANNNKAVNIGKLKNIFKDIGNLDLGNDVSHTTLHLNNDIYCDYYRFLYFIKEKHLSKEQIIEVTEMTERGGFLPECNYEWLDSYKAEVSEMVVDNLLSFSEGININNDPKLIIKIADAVFNFDNLNETALSLKCRALIILGKHSLANKTYSTFVNNYEILYQTAYNYTFLEIVSQQPENSY